MTFSHPSRVAYHRACQRSGDTIQAITPPPSRRPRKPRKSPRVTRPHRQTHLKLSHRKKVPPSSTSQSSTSHIPSSSKAAVPVVVHDDTSAKHQSKSARKPPPPKDDADVAFADSRGKDRTYHDWLTQANAPRKDTVCLLKMNSS